jgi:transcriptional regulator with XRE-family HTH domain
MPRKVDVDSPPFPKRLPKRLKAIREHLKFTPIQIAMKVGAKSGLDILAYENDEDELPVSILFGYAKLAGIPVENLIYDDRDPWLGHR